MPKTAFESPNGQRVYPKYGSELETRNPTQEISLQLKPSSVHDAYSYTMLSNNFKDLEAGLQTAKNREPKAEIHSRDLEAFSESINENRLQEDYANGRPKHDTYKTQDNGKGFKRKAWEMERKAAAVEIESRKKVEQDSRIVRVSRLTGSKDRHSKVLTTKGLRDRRVRLSIRTAIQLYDLQDRLGLEQPSKAVDWLIQAAKSALNELTVLDTEMASTSAGVAQLTFSECSNVEHCVGSPRESATATAASALSALRVGQGTNSHNATNGNVISITTVMKESDLGRSSSSTSDASIKGSAEHTSKCSMSKPVSRMEARLKARLKARERARKNSSSAKNSVGSPQSIHQKSMQPSLTSPFKNVLPHNTLPLESQCSKDDNPCGIHPQVLSGTGSVQQLLDYNNTPSCTDMLYIHDSLPLQNMAPSLTLALQKSFPPVPSTLASMQDVMESSLLQSYEMTDFAFPFFSPKQSRHLGSNAAQDQGNHLFSNIPIMTLKSVEQQQQQPAQTHIKHCASTIVPTFSNDTNFSTSSLSSREPLQSNSSFATNMPSFSHNHKNAYGDASAKSAYAFVPLEDYNVRAFQEPHNVQDNVNNEHKHPWAKEKQHH